VVVKLAGRPVYRRLCAWSDEHELAWAHERTLDALARLLSEEVCKPVAPGTLPQVWGS